jgi:hypothetical protein
MIIEVSFVLVGGLNLGLEKSWDSVRNILRKYPRATWKRVVDLKKQKGKYLVEVNN